jgi:hypothetical protein
MELDGLSSEAQAEIGNLFGSEPSKPTPEPSEVIDEAVEGEITEPTDDVVETPDEGSDDVELSDDSPESDSKPDSGDIEYIKANGKQVKIDFNDRENIKRVYSMAAGARQWQAERDTISKEKAEVDSKYNELRTTMDYLDSVKDDHETVFEAVTGMTLEAKFREWAEEQNMIGNMTEAEKSMYLSNQDHQKKLKQLQAREAELSAKIEETERRNEEMKNVKETSIANPIFFKYNFDNELGDKQLELRMNRTLWNEAKTELAGYDEVTPDMVEEAMKRISNQIRQGFKISGDNAVKKTVKGNRKSVKAKAQKMAVKEPTSTKEQELSDKIKQNDIAGILSGGYDLSNY